MDRWGDRGRPWGRGVARVPSEARGSCLGWTGRWRRSSWTRLMCGDGRHRHTGSRDRSGDQATCPEANASGGRRSEGYIGTCSHSAVEHDRHHWGGWRRCLMVAASVHPGGRCSHDRRAGNGSAAWPVYCRRARVAERQRKRGDDSRERRRGGLVCATRATKRRGQTGHGRMTSRSRRMERRMDMDRLSVHVSRGARVDVWPLMRRVCRSVC